MALLEESENALKTYQMYFDLISNRITDRAQVSEGRNWDTLLPFFTSFSPPSQTLPLAERIMSGILLYTADRQRVVVGIKVGDA